jgi:hypothetical protein
MTYIYKLLNLKFDKNEQLICCKRCPLSKSKFIKNQEVLL